MYVIQNQEYMFLMWHTRRREAQLFTSCLQRNSRQRRKEKELQQHNVADICFATHMLNWFFFAQNGLISNVLNWRKGQIRFAK